ncbi:hypothetical protein LTR05_005535 [Lithohypha guttulata]|uniref:Uncharacterized protein n=1 Tax=Lithohypha guttulata TaxID=1690604 RepID=A0AAN7Y615_9EURO|nr:hypothetical protein LTR05_005535 [Lithohypha guttulata]
MAQPGMLPDSRTKRKRNEISEYNPQQHDNQARPTEILKLGESSGHTKTPITSTSAIYVDTSMQDTTAVGRYAPVSAAVLKRLTSLPTTVPLHAIMSYEQAQNIVFHNSSPLSHSRPVWSTSTMADRKLFWKLREEELDMRNDSVSTYAQQALTSKLPRCSVAFKPVNHVVSGGAQSHVWSPNQLPLMSNEYGHEFLGFDESLLSIRMFKRQ